jgi:GrpB-like predicted nucleotidyltransferase (UPF0157 family)
MHQPEELFAGQKQRILAVLPDADVQHIGRQYEGGDMEEYIAAKHLFFERIMNDPKWLEG